MAAAGGIECWAGIQCPHCGHIHDATDNEIDGELAGTEECELCGERFSFEADYTVRWISQVPPAG